MLRSRTVASLTDCFYTVLYESREGCKVI